LLGEETEKEDKERYSVSKERKSASQRTSLEKIKRKDIDGRTKRKEKEGWWWGGRQKVKGCT